MPPILKDILIVVISASLSFIFSLLINRIINKRQREENVKSKLVDKYIQANDKAHSFLNYISLCYPFEPSLQYEISSGGDIEDSVLIPSFMKNELSYDDCAKEYDKLLIENGEYLTKAVQTYLHILNKFLNKAIIYLNAYMDKIKQEGMKDENLSINDKLEVIGIIIYADIQKWCYEFAEILEYEKENLLKNNIQNEKVLNSEIDKQFELFYRGTGLEEVLSSIE